MRAVACIKIGGPNEGRVIPFPVQGRGDVGETPEMGEEAKREEALTSGR